MSVCIDGMWGCLRSIVCLVVYFCDACVGIFCLISAVRTGSSKYYKALLGEGLSLFPDGRK